MNYKYTKPAPKATKTPAIIVLAMLLILFCWDRAHATDWTGAEISKEIAFQGLNVVDFWLTDRIIKDGGSEVGALKVVMGSTPSTDRLIITGAAVGLAHWYITDLLIDKYPRYTKLWQNVSIGGKMIPVALNFRQEF